MTPGERYRLYLDWFVWGGALLIVFSGTAVIFGWLLNIATLKSMLPGLATMKVNTACAFLAAGISLWCLQGSKPDSYSRYLARALSVVVAVLGGMTLAQDIFEIDLGIDQLILPDVTSLPTETSHPGRMSPAAAVNFVFAGIALFALKARNPSLAACAHWLVVPSLFMSALGILGYAYGVNSLYHISFYASMALHTALLFVVLSLTIIAEDGDHGFARIATCDTAGGLVSRWMLPTIPLMLFLLGWARLIGQLKGLYTLEFGLALMVTISSTVCVVALAWTATILHKVDVKRQQGVAEIVNLNANLEQRIKVRTLQLSRLSEQLSAANTTLESLSMSDGLTGLANRRSFDAYLATQMSVAYRSGRSLSLILFDVDEFKAYNDHYGHQAGDDCLKQIAAALRSCCRRPEDMVARYGGEEFAMILPGTDLTGASELANLAGQVVTELKIPHVRPLSTVSISGGVAALIRERDRNGAGNLIRAADRNLYRAKREGRNRIVAAEADAA
jgi:diguanylate cyclase (GGDEF)-like protein